MIELLSLIVIVILLSVIAAVAIGVISILWYLTTRLRTLIYIWRYGRRFFKQIERFRRDFSK